MDQRLDISKIDKSKFLANYAAWEDRDDGKLLRMKMSVECCNCEVEFGGPSHYQQVGEEEYVCPECMPKVFERVMNRMTAAVKKS